MKMRLQIFHSVTVIVLLIICSCELYSQNKREIAMCGETSIENMLNNPEYIRRSYVMLAVEPPSGWALEKNESGPIYITRVGESSKTARTIMYINVQALEDSLENAVKRDEDDYKKSCPSINIEDLSMSLVLESGCKQKHQKFTCKEEKKTAVDRVTKIAIGRILLNIVLTTDSETEALKYKKDYADLLMHVAIVVRGQ